MTINIPQNDYVTPTECRQEVVQAICDAFLHPCCYSSFTPYSEGRYRRATLLVLANRDNKFYGFSDEPHDSDKVHYRVRGCEMKAAFKCLIAAGYHIFKKYKYRDSKYQSYYVCREPFMQDAQEVFSFEDFID